MSERERLGIINFDKWWDTWNEGEALEVWAELSDHDRETWRRSAEAVRDAVAPDHARLAEEHRALVDVAVAASRFRLAAVALQDAENEAQSLVAVGAMQAADDAVRLALVALPEPLRARLEGNDAG